MAVHIIKISRGSRGEISVDPEMCQVKPRSDEQPSHIIFVFDDSFGQESQFDENDPAFPWEDVPDSRIFRNTKMYKRKSGGVIVMMEDYHLIGKNTSGNWRFGFSVKPKEPDDCPCGREGYIRSERHPVIINK